ncbi:MAG: metal-dependent hydrolase [Planctomycetes bacterium]|nr:metal-dependent hydrolase [Planctomycetota bacterium]
MDNATHTLCGLALARMGGDRLGPMATPTLVIAANLPDADAVGALWGGQPWYLCHHRGLTHAVLGLAVQAVLLGLAMTWVGRRLPERPRARALIAAAALGLLSHLALDGLNTYGVRPWLPFVDTWYYGDTAFIVDPWMWLLLGAAACLGAPPPAAPAPPADAEGLARAERLADVGAHEAARDAALAALPRAGASREVLRDAWAVGGRVATFAWWGLSGAVVLAILFSGRAPPALALVWGPLMAAVLVARQRGALRGRRRAAAWTCALLVVPYLAALRALDRAALGRAEAWVAAQGLAPDAGVCHPTPMTPWRFRALVATGPWIFDLDVDLRAGEVAPRGGVRRGLDDPLLAHPDVVGSPEHHAWRCFARLPFAARTDDLLILGDARYAPRPERAWCNLAVPLPE